MSSFKLGICCFCGNECNQCSQSCGRCARDMTMAMIGMKPSRKDLIKKDVEDYRKDIDSKEARRIRLLRRNGKATSLELMHLVRYETGK